MIGGASFSQIAKSDGMETSRIRHMISLAFLAPDILEQVVEGTHPAGFTSEWAKRHAIPADWDAQRRLIATL